MSSEHRPALTAAFSPPPTGQKPLQDIEIRVGTSPTLQQNRLCAWFPGTLEEGSEKDFRCARPMTGRYVFIQMVGVDGALSLCEVQVFSSQGESSSRAV